MSHNTHAVVKYKIVSMGLDENTLKVVKKY